MSQDEKWDRFLGSGKIEDYLLYAGDVEKPEIGTVELIAMSNAATLSGIGGMEPAATNILPALAAQQAMKEDNKKERDFPK